jgi:hypothetical protein
MNAYRPVRRRDGDRSGLPFFCFGVRNSEQQRREIWHKHTFHHGLM